MSIGRTTAICLVLAFTGSFVGTSALATRAATPPSTHDGGGFDGVGRRISDEEIRTIDISVGPTGAGLPPGMGSAVEGRHVYEARCASCHGLRGEGPDEDYPKLVGGIGTLATLTPERTVGSYWPYATTVWDYVHRAMPYDDPGTLRPNDVYAVTAYVLFLNGIVGERDVLDPRTLPSVRMPNRDGFVTDPRPDVPVSPKK